jgi:hypothetical protein
METASFFTFYHLCFVDIHVEQLRLSWLYQNNSESENKSNNIIAGNGRDWGLKY